MNDQDPQTIFQDKNAKLQRMAGDIAAFFHAYPPEKAAQSIADHINHYWSPKMRQDFLSTPQNLEQPQPEILQAARSLIKIGSIHNTTHHF